MGGKNKKKDKKKGSAAKKSSEGKKLRVTMEAIQAMSDSDDSSGMPPEEEWDENTRKLKEAIESGAFDGDDDSFEDVELADDDSKEDEQEKPTTKSKVSKVAVDKGDENDEDEEVEEDESEEDSEPGDSNEEDAPQEAEMTNRDDDESDKKNDSDKDEPEEDANEDSDDEEKLPENTENMSIRQLNAMRQKSLKALADSILNKQSKMTWPETFDVISSDPLPFGSKSDDADEAETEMIDINDDLKREVTFYNVALEAVLEGRRQCENAGIPFSRPETFFAEMVKTDDHMAKIKDRLIFENKKMEAVAQRKSNKEQKLRAKESHANKLAEKARRKKENLKAVDDYAKTAASRRGGGGLDDDSPFEPNKRRMAANKKYGFGGKRGRFKQTDSSKLNDMSSFNPRGNFSGGQKRKAGAAGKRPGKRARDASRSRN